MVTTAVPGVVSPLWETLRLVTVPEMGALTTPGMSSTLSTVELCCLEEEGTEELDVPRLPSTSWDRPMELL